MECKSQFDPNEYIANLTDKQKKAIIDKALLARYLEILRQNDLTFMNIFESAVRDTVKKQMEAIIQNGMADQYGNRKSIVMILHEMLNKRLRDQIEGSFAKIVNRINVKIDVENILAAGDFDE
jgi:ribosomal protein S17E